MNDDLISRKAVMDYLREKQANIIIEKYKENLLTHEATIEMLDAFMNFIVTMPVAYDVDKVVEQLNKTQVYQFQGKLPDGRICHYSDVIEIVKVGGANEM